MASGEAFSMSRRSVCVTWDVRQDSGEAWAAPSELCKAGLSKLGLQAAHPQCGQRASVFQLGDVSACLPGVSPVFSVPVVATAPGFAGVWPNTFGDATGGHLELPRIG